MSANRKRSYDAAFKLAAVEDAEKTGIKFLSPPSSSRCPQIITASFSGRKKLVAAAFDRGNTVGLAQSL